MKYLTVEDLSKMLQVPTSWVYEKVRQGKIPKVPHMGHYIRFNPKEIEAIFGFCSLKTEYRNQMRKKKS